LAEVRLLFIAIKKVIEWGMAKSVFRAKMVNLYNQSKGLVSSASVEVLRCKDAKR